MKFEAARIHFFFIDLRAILISRGIMSSGKGRRLNTSNCDTKYLG